MSRIPQWLLKVFQAPVIFNGDEDEGEALQESVSVAENSRMTRDAYETDSISFPSLPAFYSSSQGQALPFSWRNLPEAFKADYINTIVQASGTLQSGQVDPFVLGKSDEITREQAMARFQRAMTVAASMAAYPEPLSLLNIILLNIKLRYDRDAQAILRMTALRDRLSLDLEEALNPYSKSKLDEVFKGYGGLSADNPDYLEYTRDPLFRDTTSLTGGGRHEGRAARGRYASLNDLWPHAPVIEATLNDTGLHPLLKAAKLYQDLITFHFFKDANGRTARLAADIILMKAGLPPVLLEGRVLCGNFFEIESKDGRRVIPLQEPYLLSEVVPKFQVGMARSLQTLEKHRRRPAHRILAPLPDYRPIPAVSVLNAMTFIPGQALGAR